MEIKIGAKALHVLNGIKVISPKMRLRDDYLYTSMGPNDEVGVKGISALYVLPENEVSVDGELGLYDSGVFLKVLGTFEDPILDKNANTIQIKDKRKSLKYHTSPLNILPERKTQGEQLFEQGETILSFALPADELEKILKDIDILDFNDIVLQGDGTRIFFSCKNTTSEDEVEIDIPSALIAKSTEKVFRLPSEHNILSALMKGTYKVDIRETIMEGRPKPIMLGQFSNLDIDNGALKYFVIGN